MWYQVVVILGLMMARTALAEDQQLTNEDKKLLLVIKEVCNNNEFIATQRGKMICLGVKNAPIEPPSTTPLPSTTEIMPNYPMITIADTGAPETSRPTAAAEVLDSTNPTTDSEAPYSSSPTAASEAPDSTEGDGFAITLTCIGVVLAVIVLIAVGFFIHRYTKRAGYPHPTNSNGDTGRAGTEEMSA